MIEIVEPGPLTTIQDLGRPGLAGLGVARSGAFDRASARLANRIVGNPAGAALLELTLGGLVLTAVDATTIALAGAACPGFDTGSARTLHAGETVRLGRPVNGVRSYLAVRGGVVAEPVLGSCSTDLLGALGPARLAAGDRLAVGSQPLDPVSHHSAPTLHAGPLIVLPGPRLDWFADGTLATLAATSWRVRPDSDRVGVRLDGTPLERTVTSELPSEPTRPGAIQVPADGRPIIFGPDAPVTGGYPVIGVLADLDPAGQLRPGDLVRFVVR